ncbi:MAG: helix-turn-helix domain-containing protein [Planctomycetota bacterium]|nr:helix-turn-helix domain-containing protein [Planctomycetota bacterium]
MFPAEPSAPTAASRSAERGVDRVFRALASDVRRDILDALRDGPRPTGELVMLFPGLSRFAVMQHLRVLGRARLVVSKKTGRVRTNYLNPVPIRLIYERWVSRYEGAWAAALTSIRDAAEGVGTERTPSRPAGTARADVRRGELRGRP